MRVLIWIFIFQLIPVIWVNAKIKISLADTACECRKYQKQAEKEYKKWLRNNLPKDKNRNESYATPNENNSIISHKRKLKAHFSAGKYKKSKKRKRLKDIFKRNISACSKW